jgi:hypothetical protein
MDSFIDAKSMITPGVAGTIVMLVTNALANTFSLPGKWVALVLSFVCGLLVFGDKKLKVGPRIAFYVLNSLIVFATAVGANGIGAAASGEPAAGAATVAEATPTPAGTVATPATPEAGAAAVAEATPAPAGTVATPATPAPIAPTPVPPGRIEGQKTFFKPWLTRAAVEVQTPR